MTNDAFMINQSKLKILLYDTDPESCEEVSTLLTKCSYEGTVSFYLIFLFIYLLIQMGKLLQYCLNGIHDRILVKNE